MPRSRNLLRAGVVASFLVAQVTPGLTAERSYPLDCLPDRVVAWNAAGALPDQMFGAAFLPGIVVGPPGESVEFQGATSVASLGFGGSAVIAFDDTILVDGPGPDFIIFENAFFKLPLPATSQDDFLIFAEPGIVEVSADGQQWFAFPYDPLALAAMIASPLVEIDRDEYMTLTGLAGITPSFTGNWTVPDDPAVFDPSGTGGVSGAGGDAFDLADVGLAEARYVRITDANTQAGFPGTAEGFDLDTVVALHGRPGPPSTLDSDGDLLSDLEELDLYGTNPALADSDGDGIDDGREVAACRDPHSAATAPALHSEPRLWVLGNDCTELRWTFAGSGQVYDVIRTERATAVETGSSVELGPGSCLTDDNLTVRWSCDASTPPESESFFYVVRVDGGSGYGRSGNLKPREAVPDCP